MMRVRVAAIVAIAVAGMMLAGCGYRFTGGGKLPANISSIAVEIMENRSGETGVENTFTNDLIFELQTNSDAAIRGPAEADAVLTGVIDAIQVTTIARIDVSTSQERRVKAFATYQLVGADKTVLWKRSGLTANEAYEVTDDKLETERNKREAIEALSKRMAELVYNSMTSDF